jgi:hypothetical protein
MGALAQTSLYIASLLVGDDIMILNNIFNG